MNVEKYYLKNDTTKLFLKGFDGCKPLWAETKKNAIAYKEMDALHLQLRLENLYLPYQKILLVEEIRS